MANQQKVQGWMLRPEDLQELEELQTEIQDRMTKASEDGSVLLMQTYTTFLAHVTSIVHKTRARFNRDNLASARKTLQQRKEELRGQSPEDE